MSSEIGLYSLKGRLREGALGRWRKDIVDRRVMITSSCADRAMSRREREH